MAPKVKIEKNVKVPDVSATLAGKGKSRLISSIYTDMQDLEKAQAKLALLQEKIAKHTNAILEAKIANDEEKVKKEEKALKAEKKKLQKLEEEKITLSSRVIKEKNRVTVMSMPVQTWSSKMLKSTLKQEDNKFQKVLKGVNKVWTSNKAVQGIKEGLSNIVTPIAKPLSDIFSDFLPYISAAKSMMMGVLKIGKSLYGLLPIGRKAKAHDTNLQILEKITTMGQKLELGLPNLQIKLDEIVQKAQELKLSNKEEREYVYQKTRELVDYYSERLNNGFEKQNDDIKASNSKEFTNLAKEIKTSQMDAVNYQIAHDDKERLRSMTGKKENRGFFDNILGMLSTGLPGILKSALAFLPMMIFGAIKGIGGLVSGALKFLLAPILKLLGMGGVAGTATGVPTTGGTVPTKGGPKTTGKGGIFKRIFKGAGRLLKVAGPVGAAITAGIAFSDFVDGFDNDKAKELFGNDGTFAKIGSGLSSVISGLSFGLISTENVANGIKKIAEISKDAAKAAVAGAVYAKDMVKKGLGWISAKFESGKLGAGAVSSGKGDFGGVSYGKYQLSQKTVQDFVSQSKYREKFAGLQAGSEAFNKQWKAIAATDPEFEQEQHAYIGKTHYVPQLNKLRKNSIDLAKRGKAVQEMIWSTAVQYGGNTDIIMNALKGMNVANMSDSDIIKTVQDYKLRNVGKHFAKSSAAVQSSVANRISNEESMLLAQANAEKGTGTIAKSITKDEGKVKIPETGDAVKAIRNGENAIIAATAQQQAAILSAKQDVNKVESKPVVAPLSLSQKTVRGDSVPERWNIIDSSIIHLVYQNTV